MRASVLKREKARTYRLRDQWPQMRYPLYMAGPSPLLGYNTNVRHNGKLFHIQTEDSGVNHPHIITHLFADGGRIIASKKTGYADNLGAEGLQAIVKQMMQGQHKAMFIELRDGLYDEEDVPVAKSRSTDAADGKDAAEQARLSQQELENLEAAAQRVSKPNRAGGLDPRKTERPPKLPGKPTAPRYQPTRPPASMAGAEPRTKPPASIFGGDLLSEKSLDEVILSYLAEDLDNE